MLLASLCIISCEDEDPQQSTSVSEDSSLRDAIVPLTSPEDLDTLVSEIATSRYVLLGEASHGTSEYYTWRAKLSQQLIEEKGFNIIAVEGVGQRYMNSINISMDLMHTATLQEKCSSNSTVGLPGCGPMKRWPILQNG